MDTIAFYVDLQCNSKFRFINVAGRKIEFQPSLSQGRTIRLDRQMKQQSSIHAKMTIRKMGYNVHYEVSVAYLEVIDISRLKCQEYVPYVWVDS